MENANNLRVALPIPFPDSDDKLQAFIENAKRQAQEYNANEVAAFFPSKGLRVVGFPTDEYIISGAQRFKKASQELAKYGIDLVSFFTLTVKSGRRDDLEPIIRADGSVSPVSSCVLGENFRKALPKMIALFVSIAKPKYLLLEDDFSVSASSYYGCFCPLHLKEFAKIVGKEYDRQTLVDLFKSNTKKGLALYKKWRTFMGDTLIDMAKAIRKEVDILSPEIRLGCMQTGADELDGYSMFKVAKALAGVNHKPICRPRGTFYCGGNSKDLPPVMFNAMKTAQDYKGKMDFVHESDAYPHNRFYTGAKQMDVITSSAISYGENGVLLFAEGFAGGKSGEENTYGKNFAKQYNRLNTIYKMVKNCSLDGVELNYDWFYNKLQNGNPLWCRPLGLFGVPTTSKRSKVAFWDSAQVRSSNDKTIKEYLSKVLFLDGDAAKILIERGYGEYVGVTLGEKVDKPPFVYDLSVKEVIDTEFTNGDVEEMPCGHAYCPSGSGVTYPITATNSNVKVITSYYDRLGNKICDTATMYKNSLGGTVIVFGQTLYGNLSQSIYNYPRQRLIQKLIQITADEYVTCVGEPNLWTIVNKPNKAKTFNRLVSVYNLGYDGLETFTLRVPSAIGQIKGVQILGANGKWKRAKCTINGEYLTINTQLDPLAIEYVKII